MFSRSVATAAFFGALFLASSLSTAHAATIRGLAGKCLTVTGDNSTNGTPIILSGCNGGVGQQWRIVNGEVIAPALAVIEDKCLDVSGKNSTNGTPIILFDCTGGANQAWTVDRGQIRGLLGKCLDVSGNNSTNGTPIILFDCTSRINQKWIID